MDPARRIAELKREWADKDAEIAALQRVVAADRENCSTSIGAKVLAKNSPSPKKERPHERDCDYAADSSRRRPRPPPFEGSDSPRSFHSHAECYVAQTAKLQREHSKPRGKDSSNLIKGIADLQRTQTDAELRRKNLDKRSSSFSGLPTASTSSSSSSRPRSTTGDSGSRRSKNEKDTRSLAEIESDQARAAQPAMSRPVAPRVLPVSPPAIRRRTEKPDSESEEDEDEEDSDDDDEDGLKVGKARKGTTKRHTRQRRRDSLDYCTWVGRDEAHTATEGFYGIPFAQPPVGNLRFAPPVAPTSSFGVFDASKYGPICPQGDVIAGTDPSVLEVLANTALDLLNATGILVGLTGGQEDCLTINIQRPVGTTADSRLPVFGGAFQFGGSSTYENYSHNLIQTSVEAGSPVIFVSINYRVSSFGFLGGAEMRADPTTTPNAGLMDQRLALEWVQKNIANFGGDPTKVTATGESSGAMSIGLQMVAYDGKLNGLFRGAIMESGSALSYTSLTMQFVPRTDGVFLTKLAQELVEAGSYAKDVAIISGDQYDEVNLTTTADVDDWLKHVIFPHATDEMRAEILDLYPEDPTQGSPFDTGFLNMLTPQNKRINAIVGDVAMQAWRKHFISFTKKTQPTWSYSSRVFKNIPFLGSFHVSDIAAVFGIFPTPPAKEMQVHGVGKNLIQFSEMGSTIIQDTFREKALAYWPTIAKYVAL
ncbi:hypothetical protein RQP46_002988 [Phenoliferia psychrophenolica]